MTRWMATPLVVFTEQRRFGTDMIEERKNASSPSYILLLGEKEMCWAHKFWEPMRICVSTSYFVLGCCETAFHPFLESSTVGKKLLFSKSFATGHTCLRPSLLSHWSCNILSYVKRPASESYSPKLCLCHYFSDKKSFIAHMWYVCMCVSIVQSQCHWACVLASEVAHCHVVDEVGGKNGPASYVQHAKKSYVY